MCTCLSPHILPLFLWIWSFLNNQGSWLAEHRTTYQIEVNLPLVFTSYPFKKFTQHLLICKSRVRHRAWGGEQISSKLVKGLLSMYNNWNEKDFVPSKTCTGSVEDSDAPPMYLKSKEQGCISGKMTPLTLAGQINKEQLFSGWRNRILKGLKPGPLSY